MHLLYLSYIVLFVYIVCIYTLVFIIVFYIVQSSQPAARFIMNDLLTYQDRGIG